MILVKTLTVTLWTWLQTIFITRGASQSPKFRSEVIGHTIFTATTLKTRYELISTTIVTLLSRISFLKIKLKSYIYIIQASGTVLNQTSQLPNIMVKFRLVF